MLVLAFVAVAVGLAVGAPVGPAGVLVMESAISRGFRAAFPLALGAALGDGVLAVAINLGLWSALSGRSDVQAVVTLIGGSLLAVFSVVFLMQGVRAYRHWRSGSPDAAPAPATRRVHVEVLNGMLVTVLNPANVAGMTAVLGGFQCPPEWLALEYNDSPTTALVVSAGIAVGSCGAFSAAAAIGAATRHGMSPPVRAGIKAAAGVVLAAFSAVMIGRAAVRA